MREFGCSSTQHLIPVGSGATCARTRSLTPASPAEPLALVGLNHRTASASLRSRVAVSREDLPAFLTALRERGAEECVVLSTCNRTEIYFTGTNPDAVAQLLAERAQMPLEELQPALYVKRCVCAACHLFRVTAGLDSAVLGESEIVAQVKDAWRMATEAGTNGAATDLALQRSLEASKRIRSETALCRSVTSLATLAVRNARDRFDLSQAEVLVLGAGQIAERTVRELESTGARRVRVLNRTRESANTLAERHGYRAGGLDQLDEALQEADVAIACLTLPAPILDESRMATLAARRSHRPLLVLDLGMPPNAATPPEGSPIAVVGVDRLAAECSANQEARLAAVPQALQILDQELQRYGEALLERAAAPTIRALLQRGEQIKQRNLDWAKDRLGHLDERELRVVEELARRMMMGLLQEPIEGLKREFSSREHRESIERLFGLSGGSDS